MNENDLFLAARLIQLATSLLVRLAEQANMTEDELFARAKAKFAENDDKINDFIRELER